MSSIDNLFLQISTLHMLGVDEMNIKILRADSHNKDFHKLIKLLDCELSERYGES